MSEGVGEKSGAPLIVVSNRGPVCFDRDDEGNRVERRGAGGLVTALSGLPEGLRGGVWICLAVSDEDALVAREHGGGSFDVIAGARRHPLRMVEVEPEAYHAYYNVFANPTLWFLQHYLWDLGTGPDVGSGLADAFHSGYVPVNERVAEVVAEEVATRRRRAIVMLHDYHLYLVGEGIRERCPDAFLHHFVHIPWPQPDAWRVLPASIREPLVRGLLANDVVAFHTQGYARNFLLTCQELLDVPVDFRRFTVSVGERIVAVRWFPISIDVPGLEAMAGSPEVVDHEQRLAASRREHLIIRVDRADPSKNIVRGFKAFGLLLDRHPELAQRVTFLALVQESRSSIPEYHAYLDEIQRVVAEVNSKYGSAAWQPIDLRVEDNLAQAVAAYKQFDVLVVNSLFDGMNLVAKEAMLVNERDGVLVLSENAGAHAELGAFALTVHPLDLDDQAAALHAALTMPGPERRERRRACEQIVRHNDLSRWLDEQLIEVERIRAGSGQ